MPQSKSICPTEARFSLHIRVKSTYLAYRMQQKSLTSSPVLQITHLSQLHNCATINARRLSPTQKSSSHAITNNFFLDHETPTVYGVCHYRSATRKYNYRFHQQQQRSQPAKPTAPFHQVPSATYCNTNMHVFFRRYRLPSSKPSITIISPLGPVSPPPTFDDISQNPCQQP